MIEHPAGQRRRCRVRVCDGSRPTREEELLPAATTLNRHAACGLERSNDRAGASTNEISLVVVAGVFVLILLIGVQLFVTRRRLYRGTSGTLLRVLIVVMLVWTVTRFTSEQDASVRDNATGRTICKCLSAARFLTLRAPSDRQPHAGGAWSGAPSSSRLRDIPSGRGAGWPRRHRRPARRCGPIALAEWFPRHDSVSSAISCGAFPRRARHRAQASMRGRELRGAVTRRSTSGSRCPSARRGSTREDRGGAGSALDAAAGQACWFRRAAFRDFPADVLGRFPALMVSSENGTDDDPPVVPSSS